MQININGMHTTEEIFTGFVKNIYQMQNVDNGTLHIYTLVSNDQVPCTSYWVDLYYTIKRTIKIIQVVLIKYKYTKYLHIDEKSADMELENQEKIESCSKPKTLNQNSTLLHNIRIYAV